MRMCVVVVLPMLDKKRASLCTCPGLHFKCVCVCRFLHVCVLLSKRIPAVTLQSSDNRGEATRLSSAAVSSKEIWRRRFFFAINDKAGRYISFCVDHLCQGRHLGR